MGLFVDYIPAERAAGDLVPDAWAVVSTRFSCLEDSKSRWAPAAGFARKLDAELAMGALLKCGFRWNGTSEEAWTDFDRFGGKDGLQRIACEALQW